MSDPPTYHYPDTHEERVQWHERGTPAPFSPYAPEAPDDLRDGLLRGCRVHVARKRG